MHILHNEKIMLGVSGTGGLLTVLFENMHANPAAWCTAIPIALYWTVKTIHKLTHWNQKDKDE